LELLIEKFSEDLEFVTCLSVATLLPNPCFVFGFKNGVERGFSGKTSGITLSFSAWADYVFRYGLSSLLLDLGMSTVSTVAPWKALAGYREFYFSSSGPSSSAFISSILINKTY
jgi:hypothetical protein